jgi:hypothetical protein
MDQTESRNIARNMMSVHGLRAQAVVQERLTEARARGDTTGMERWQTVEAMIAELRRTGRSSLARA